MTAARARAYIRIVFLVTVVVSVYWVWQSRGGLDPLGKPLGTDFTSFWTASRIALGGEASGAYDIVRHGIEQQHLFGRDIGYFAFFYPPIFLLICLPLSALPYQWSLLAWLGITGTAYWRVAQAFLGKAVGILPVVAFPAVLVNVGHGQNGFMSAALFGAGALVLDRYPKMAGILFGCLAYKPQLAVVIPIALAGARRWNTLIAAGSTALGLALLSLAVFGPNTWQAFLAMSSVAKATLESGFVDPAKMQSTFAAFRLLHASVVTAYLAQVVILLAACAAQHRTIGTPAEGPAMIAAALLATPFLLDYDLLLLAIPLAWLTREGLRTGFLRWEKIGLMAGFILPAVSRTLALTLSLPLAPAVIGAILFLMVRRAARETANSIALPVETRQAGAATVAVMAGP